MYGFGDVSQPLEETIAVVEELAVMYMRDLAVRAVALARKETIKVTFRTSDVLFAVRKDRKKLWRGGEAVAFHKSLEQHKAEISVKDTIDDVTVTGKHYGADKSEK